MKPAWLGVIVAACCLAQVPGQTVSLTGTVTNASGEPVRRASVRLTQLGPRQGVFPEPVASEVTVETGPQGNFSFDEVVPGRYWLTAEHAGYLNSGYVNDRGNVLTINPGQALSAVVLKMTRQEIIPGRVTDEDGEPMPGVSIGLLRAAAPGQQQIIAAQSSDSTNADGAFALGNLPPGRYYISATPTPRLAPAPASRRSGEETYVTMYYPEATGIEGATAIDKCADSKYGCTRCRCSGSAAKSSTR